MKPTTAWPASESRMRKVAELIPYARNARTHTPGQVKQIAASIIEWGFTNPVLIDDESGILAGHGRVLAAQSLGIEEVPCVMARGWTESQKRAYVLADNKLAMNAGWDEDLLAVEVGELKALDFNLELTGFSVAEIADLLKGPDKHADALKGADDAKLPEVRAKAVSQLGDVWLLGPHRLMCGDSTRASDVADLMVGATASCVHADPPYGMGKEAEGVANDNLYRDKLDAFQMAWWTIYREHLADNGALYVWGNAPDLWRLWYVGGLSLAGDLMLRNELVWAKGSAFGMKSDLGHSYPPETERCIFLMRGQQFLGNQNKEDYWEGWEPLRAWLEEQRELAGWKNSDVNRITGTNMAGHWFTKSQFQPISSGHYSTLSREAAGRAFVESYGDLYDRLFPGARAGGNEHRRELAEALRETRTWFDNGHDAMTDVWTFPRVLGEERFGHATPKPVAMIGRAIRSSVPEDGLVVEPFSGTGTTLIAAHLLGRRCYAMELEPTYVDVGIRRWQEKAGAAAVHEETGRTFASIESGGR